MTEEVKARTENTQRDALFKSFNAAIKKSLVYSPSHPMCAEARAELFDNLKTYLADNEQLKFGITRDSIIVEGTEYGMGEAGYYLALAAHLHDRQITSVTVYSPVQNFEMDVFLDIMALDPNELRKRGGVEDVLDEKRVRNIVAKRLEVEAAEATDELIFDEDSDRTMTAEEMYMLFGEADLSTNETGKIILRATQGSVDTAKLLVKISDIAASAEGDPSLEGRAEYLTEAIRKLSEMTVSSPENRETVFTNIAEGLYNLNEDFRSPIIDIIQDRLASLDFGPELMAALDKAMKLAEEQTAGYTESGAQATVETKDEVRLSPEEVYYEFAHFYDEMSPTVEQMVQEEIGAIEEEDIEEEAIKTFVEMLFNAEDEPHLRKTLDSLEAGVRDLLTTNRLELAAKAFKALRIRMQDLQKTSPELMALPRDRILRLAEGDNLRTIVNAALMSDNADDKRCGRVMLDTIGAGAVPGLLELIAAEANTQQCQKLMTVAARLSGGDLAIFEKRLNDPDVKLAKIAVAMMANFDEPKATDIIKQALRHDAEDVRIEAIRVLASSLVPSAASLILVSLDDSAKKVRDKAFEALGVIRAPAAVAKLVQLATRKERFNRNINSRLQAVRTLGEIGTPEALPELEKLAKTRAYIIGRKHVAALREEANEAIEKIRTTGKE